MNQPHSVEAEEYVLSCVLLEGATALSRALEARVVPECFFVAANQNIWKTVLFLHKRNLPIDLPTLVSELKEASKKDGADRLAACGGVQHVVDVSGRTVTVAQFGYFLRILKEHYTMRRLIAVAQSTIEKAQGRTASVEDFATEINELLSAHSNAGGLKTILEAVRETQQLAKRLRDGTTTQEDMGMPWPFPSWDKGFGPIGNGELAILGARPGMGKSSIARQCALSWMERGHVVMFSREMPVEQIAPLLAQQQSGISWKYYRSRDLFTADMDKFDAALSRMEARLANGQTRTLHVYDTDHTLAEVKARVMAFKQQHQPKAVIVDYLQRYDPQQQRSENRDLAIGRMTTAFKDMAIDLNVPVLLLCQVGRDVEKGAREPRLSDLRESGNIEADADRVIFLHAPEKNNEGISQDVLDGNAVSIQIDVIQAKGRSDGRGRIPMIFQPPTTTFRDL